MALTYLDLTNSLLKKFNEVPLTSADFTNAYGFQDICKEAINYIVADINQAEFFWPFNYVEGSISTVANQRVYPAPTSSKLIDWDSFYLEKDASKNVMGAHLSWIMTDVWNEYYRANDLNYNANDYRVPELVYPTPGMDIGVSPIPDQVYSIKYAYYQNHDELSAFGDTTRIPTTYKNVIIDGASWYVYMAQEDGQKATIAWERYEAGRNNMRSLLINNHKEVYVGRGRGRSARW